MCSAEGMEEEMEVGGAVQGECGYCGERVGERGEAWMPLECNACHQLFHVRCLKGRRPPVLRGDRLWQFTCSLCHSLHKETWSRPHLQWVHVIHLVLYHLMVTQNGKEGYFRWNEDICGCIQRHWQALMPHRKRTQSWHSTVAGTLSVHCPSLFQSGAKQLGESGYWTLTSLTPPDPAAMKAGSKGVKSNVEGEGKRVSILEVPVVMEAQSQVDSPPSPPSPSPSSPSHPTFTPSHSSLSPISPRQEAILLAHLQKASVAIGYCPKASRLRRKLKMRQHQRNHGYPTFDIDRHITHSLSTTVKYVVNEEKPYSDQIVPVVQRVCSPSLHPPSHPYHTILHHISFPLLSPTSPSPSTRLTAALSGRSQDLTPISSPYTARLLKPYIFRSKELRPPQVRLLQDSVGHYVRTHPQSDHAHHAPHSLDLCYLQCCHVSACNGLLAHFFWPVDISDSLNCPDFTCVALYGKLVVGCAFMTPDVKVGEAYISFLLAHPQFSGAGLGRLMLYHLIQSCLGKDVTLHVSVDNPAMLLYQSFGFKAEQYCLDFYDRYFPPSHPHSRHAYFMRLHR